MQGRLTSESVLRTHSVFLRKAGLSGTKTKTLKAIAMSIENNSLDLLSLHRLPEEALPEILLSVWGLGPWSVDMFMMHSLGREDVFSAGDLGLVRAMEAIYNLPKIRHVLPYCYSKKMVSLPYIRFPATLENKRRYIGMGRVIFDITTLKCYSYKWPERRQQF